MKFMVFFFFRRSGIGSQYYMVCCMCVGNMSKKSVKRNYQNCVCNLFLKTYVESWLERSLSCGGAVVPIRHSSTCRYTLKSESCVQLAFQCIAFLFILCKLAFTGVVIANKTRAPVPFRHCWQ